MAYHNTWNRLKDNVGLLRYAVAQYGSGPCAMCDAPLSIYNPYWVCASCRVGVETRMDGYYPWEVYQREPVDVQVDDEGLYDGE